MSPPFPTVDDELGGGVSSEGHEATFTRLLQSLGVPATQLAYRPAWPEVEAFNRALMDLCTEAPPLTALAALGMIEDQFCQISSYLGGAIVEAGWATAGELAHYAAHEELGVEHAEAFYRTLEPGMLGSEVDVGAGLERGASIFMAMYDGLYEARERRD